MSNGESKIVESKAALCCGFAIALRALFLGILCLLIASLALAMTQKNLMFNMKWRCDFSRTPFVIARGASLAAIKRI